MRASRYLLLGLSFVTCLSEISGHDEVVDFNNKWRLRAGKTELPLRSVMYPKPSPGNIIQTWTISAPPDTVIRLTCQEIHMPKLRDGKCQGGVFIFSIEDGEIRKSFCGTHTGIDYISSTRSVFIYNRINEAGGGRFSCTIRALSLGTGPRNARSAPSEEQDQIDSSEHGGPQGAVSTTCPCGWANKAELRVIGGKETDINEYPFNVGLTRKGAASPHCGGSIITAYHILTSAHCVSSFVNKPEALEVMIGEHNWKSQLETVHSSRVAVSKIEAHDEFLKNDKSEFDIAMLVLSKKLEFNKYVGPVCLPNKQLNLEGSYVKIIGWGTTTSRGKLSEHVREVNIKAITLKKCRDFYGNLIDLNEPRLLCTYTKMKGIGPGDSGGPVVWLNPETNRYTLVALPTYIALYDKDQHIYPDINTDIWTHLGWIQDKIQNSGQEGVTCTAED
uniref:Venom S1 protease with CUB domain 3 n=1 Tax=Lethocerus distinctifemur TaxID=280095 RepID=A0A2K8JL18_9HEMI|nr:venom S1 protease with CUB domain 3 [Lethocerus distinctifemur]